MYNYIPLDKEHRELFRGFIGYSVICDHKEIHIMHRKNPHMLCREIQNNFSSSIAVVDVRQSDTRKLYGWKLRKICIPTLIDVQLKDQTKLKIIAKFC